jgi:hypothetical protein
MTPLDVVTEMLTVPFCENASVIVMMHEPAATGVTV